MATTVRIEMNSANFRAFLRSQEVLDLVMGPAEKIAAAAGEGHEASGRVGSNRARASVVTATFEARKSEALDKTLTSAISAGRS